MNMNELCFIRSGNFTVNNLINLLSAETNVGTISIQSVSRFCFIDFDGRFFTFLHYLKITFLLPIINDICRMWELTYSFQLLFWDI